MKENKWIPLIAILLMFYTLDYASAQNRSFMVSLSLGVGNSGFKIQDQNDDIVKRIYYPTTGIQVQKRINSKWAINIYPNVGMSGNRRIFNDPIGNVTEVKSTSTYVNLSLHPKYFITKSIYFSLGPEVSYLIRNYGSSYNDEDRLSHVNETELFNRTNILISSALGFSKKIEESRKDAPIQIDALWYIELRAKKGITNILNEDVFGDELSTSILSFEIIAGISFASQK